MPRPLLGYGPERARRIAALRAVGVVVAVALGAVAVWLIVTGNTQKRIELGVLAGLWGFLIGAYCTFGNRGPMTPEPPVAVMPAFDPSVFTSGAGVLDLRPSAEVERQHEAEARREMQAHLEKVLRREVQEGLARELAGLRAEVAALRSELVEKVGGELRLERIETTRLIGSDIEALHRQMRELKTLNAADEGADYPAGYADEFEVVEDAEVVDEAEGEPEPVAPPAAAPLETRPADAVLVEASTEPVPQPEPEPVVAEPEPAVAAEPEPEPVVAEVEPEPVVAEAEPAAAEEPVAESEPESRFSSDPFAAMPRLSPFTDFEPVAEPSPAASGEAEPSAAADPSRRGGRRYREDDSEDNVLARILQREGMRSK